MSRRYPCGEPGCTECRPRLDRRHVAVAVAGALLLSILGANYLTTVYERVWVLGLSATAGTYLAGATFVLRDSLQDLAGKRAVVALIAAGAVLSYFVAAPLIALASGVAFAASELADLVVYTPLRRRGYLRAAVASNAVGAVVDTFLFLWIAGFSVTRADVAGQIVGKLVVTAIVATVVAVVVARYRRQSVAP